MISVCALDGDLAFSGTLEGNKEAPVGSCAIRVSFDLKSAATEDQVATLIRLTELHCVVFQTLATSPPLAVAATFLG